MRREETVRNGLVIGRNHVQTAKISDLDEIWQAESQALGSRT
jgi:hypothetical protein